MGREKNDNLIDRLPDDILCNIISRLKLIEASRSSILSKRWRKIWTMNDRLMFSCHPKYRIQNAYVNRRKFMDAVNQCLQLYSGLKLKIFHVYCCFLNDQACDLLQWMQNLARLDVEDLFLGHINRTCNDCLSDSFFTFSFKLIDGLSRLKSLRLLSCYVESSFVNQCISLESLVLFNISLINHELSDILVSCPNLSSLSVKCCRLPLNLRISGPNLKLENLMLVVCENVQKLEISDFNVTSLMIDIRNEVEISLFSVPKLQTLHLGTPRMNYRFGDVTKDMPQLKSLLIHTPYQILRLPPVFHIFRTVRTLHLMTSGYLYRKTHESGYLYRKTHEEVDLWKFAPVLGICPLLEEFYLQVGGPVCRQGRKEQWPVLRHKNLALMELSGFSNTQNELEFAKFILTSAQVLRSLTLRLSSKKFGGHFSYFEDKKVVKQKDAQVVCAELKGHALSMNATVKLF